MPEITITQHGMKASEFNDLGSIHPTGKYTLSSSAVYFSVVYTINGQELDMTYFGDAESIICRKIIEASEFLQAQSDTGDEPNE